MSESGAGGYGRYTYQLICMADRELAKDVSDIATSRGRSVSETMRYLLREGITSSAANSVASAADQ